ncbi:MAG: hypothetical protein P4L53_15570 [Candidatus Obscuribacterales bacterium]|nr:hypothetical protein [Candidatus Obscuribacterales bacterium]
MLSATISGIILFSLWQHTEFFSYLIHVSKDGYLNRSLADIILSVAFTLPIILTLEIYFYQRQRKCRWQSLLFDKNVLTDTFMVSSFLFWYLPILLLTLANAIDANAVVSISRCLLMCSVPSLMAMALAGCISTSSRYKHIPGIDALSLKKYCHFLEDDNFSYAGLDDMTAAQLLDLTNIAVKIGDLEKADIISSYHLATVSPDLAFD